MIVRVLYFASLKERAGSREESVDVPDGFDIASLWSMLQERHPGLAEVTTRPLAACDLNYAAWDRLLIGTREVAFLPPSSGG